VGKALAFTVMQNLGGSKLCGVENVISFVTHTGRKGSFPFDAYAICVNILQL